MAQSRSFFDDVKRELECSVCKEQFSGINEPKILKCLHTFCKSCLEAWLRQQGGGALSCPTCRQITECPNNNVSSLPSNLFYKQMVDIVTAYSGQEDSPYCGNCDERKSLKFYCSECNFFLCEECAWGHKKFKVLSGHHVKEIGNFKPSDAQDYARRLNACKQHNDEVRFYCEQCVICICRDCAILEHRDHNIVSLDKGLEKKKSEIEIKMRAVQANVPYLRSEIESIEKRRLRMNNSIEQATEEVHRAAERNIELIRQHEECVTEQLMKHKETSETAFSNTTTGLDAKLIEIQSSLDFGNDVLERNNLPEILNVEEVLERRFQELLEPCAVSTKVNLYSVVKYVPNDLSSLKDSPGKLFTTNTEPSLSLADGKGLTEGREGEDCTFTVITKDSQGENTYSEIDGFCVCIKSQQTGTTLKANITDSQDGCYKVSYKPEVAGEFNVDITVAGEAIKGSPFQLKVKERKQKRKGKKKEKSRESPDQEQLRAIHDQSECCSCSNENKEAVYPSQCGHHFCKSCRNKLRLCIMCGQDMVIPGNQPAGHVTCRTDLEHSLPGYEDCGTIIIGCNFDKGIQGPEHPNPGLRYWCLFCTAYLPNNPEGQEMCNLLKKAFDGRLLFTIGEENTIVSNGIELKTSSSGDSAKCGYPDPGYLDRLKSQLAEKGITQLHELGTTLP
ncbi:E3 ubiquitin-protein ligase TRIM45-like [Oculina patagonica]